MIEEYYKLIHHKLKIPAEFEYNQKGIPWIYYDTIQEKSKGRNIKPGMWCRDWYKYERNKFRKETKELINLFYKEQREETEELLEWLKAFEEDLEEENEL